NTGTVRRIVNGTLFPRPLLDVNVATFAHRGLLGIAAVPLHYGSLHNENATTVDGNATMAHVFLYFTQAATRDRDDITEGKKPLGNRLYRYELVNNHLIEPKLLLNLPAGPGAIGYGGEIVIGPDNNLYLSVGDIGIDRHITKAQNFQNGSDPDGTSGILRVDEAGKKVNPAILGSKYPLNLYYSYGLWNSFGMDFDPVSGKLWDTENGLIFGDEINLVEPGFNSGYGKIDGVWLRGYSLDETERHPASSHPGNLVGFEGRGKYHPPNFTWFRSVAPTAIKFLSSESLGKQYRNDMFVCDIINGYLYHLKLNPQRTDLDLSLIRWQIAQMWFSRLYLESGITDIKVGPGGNDRYLYVLTFSKAEGTIFRIIPKD
ncbi:MAG: PQQ-dependent sugar dehydrogenase, partial [Nitrososphaeraceae archaeon]